MNRWIIPGENEYVKPSGYPFRIILTIIILMFVLSVAYYALTIPQGDKYGKALLDNAFDIPVSLSILLVGFSVTFYRIYAFSYKFSNFLEQYGMYHWKSWAIERLILLDYSSISPVEDLALKMQKLEGEAPFSPNTPLRIPVEADSMDESRLQKVLVKLIEPIKDSLIRGNYQFQTWVYVKGNDESVCDELNLLFANLSISRNMTGEIHYLETCPDYSLINKWIDEGTRQNRLLITIELHNESETDFFESASAFVFTGQSLLQQKDTPLYLLRTMDSTSYNQEQTAKAYFSAKQVEVDKIKRLWSSSLDKQAKFTLYAATENAKTGVMADSRYELEPVTGRATEGQRWFLLTLAADAARYGQGHQLIASSAADKVYTGIVTSKNPGRWREPWTFDTGFYWMFTALFLFSSLLFFVCTILPEGYTDKSGWFSFGILIFFLLISVIGIGLVFDGMIKGIQSDMGIYHPDYK